MSSPVLLKLLSFRFQGKVVYKKKSEAAKKTKGGKALVKWGKALAAARKNLKITKFVACKKDGALYRERKRIYEETK